MTAATASIVVVALFGVLIGVILQVVIQIIPRFRDAGKVAVARAEEGKVRQLLGQAVEQAEASRVQIQDMSRSQQFAILVFYSLIAMFVLVIKLSPVRMNWGIFCGSAFAGFVLADFVFWLARTNRIRVKSRPTDLAS